MSSNRVKRLLKKIENFRGKNKRRRISGGSDDDCGKGSSVWTPKFFGDYPSSNIYNSSARIKPAELFRKDLISAMKLPDSEPLTPDDYWYISDQWKQEWERGVQVPVNPDALPEPVVRLKKKEKVSDFKLPKCLIRLTQNDFYSSEIHHLSNVKTQAENVCRYDLDEQDVNWLHNVNQHLKEQGLPLLKEDAMEKAIEELETQCYDNMQEVIQAETGLGIEFDEDVICDVCRSPDSEEGNEMVFCDSCDICVHQACYGITEIPTGSWICRGCDSGLKPSCVLCPNKGGAMKCTRTGQQWVHVSCALWIPEVSIGCVEKMEPITKLANIPQSRWTLLCCICKEKMGACIQCSVKACKTAYHVTCGFRGGLEMKAVIVDDEHDVDGVKLRSYCPKHSKNKNQHLGAESDDEGSEKQLDDKKDEKNSRAQKLQQIENSFYRHVNLNVVSEKLNIDKDVLEYVYYYWKLKRRAAFNKPLLATRSGHTEDLDREDGVFARMKMFVQIRQDLERVRNLCYMVTRREKLSRSWCNFRESIFRQQLVVLSDPTLNLSETERTSVIHSCHGSSVYDKMYAFNNCCCQTKNENSATIDEKILTESEREKTKRCTPNSRLPNPYAKTYPMSRSCRLSRRLDDCSLNESDNVDTIKESASFTPNKNNTIDESETTCRSSLFSTDLQSSVFDDGLESNSVYPLRSARTRQRNSSSSGKTEKITCTYDIESVGTEETDILNEDDASKDVEANFKREDDLTENVNRHAKNRKSRQKYKLTKSHLKELVTKNNSTEDASQCRVKQRQESEKIHESLFSTSQKGKLAGYRIPKKPRNETKTENKFLDNDGKQDVLNMPPVQTQDSLPQASPPKDPRLSSPNFISQNHPQTSPFKVSTPQQQQISSPRSPRSVSQTASSAATCPPRLVMKLRKDRNYPESQQKWMRANDMTSNLSVYDFPCEQNQSPTMQGCVNNISHEPQSSTFYDYSQNQRYSLAVGHRSELKSSEKRTNFNSNNNNYTEARPTRTNIVNSVAVHTIQSTYY